MMVEIYEKNYEISMTISFVLLREYNDGQFYFLTRSMMVGFVPLSVLFGYEISMTVGFFLLLLYEISKMVGFVTL